MNPKTPLRPSSADHAQTLTQLNSEHIHVRQERCIIVRNRNAACLRCAQACTSGCISYNEDTKAVTIDQSHCVGCGTCATACPTCSLEPRDPSDVELLNRLRTALDAPENTSREARIACEEAAGPQAHGAQQVKCLGRIDESVILQLAASGASKVTLACGPCETCEHKPGRAIAEEVCKTANNLLELWGSPMRADIREAGGSTQGDSCGQEMGGASQSLTAGQEAGGISQSPAANQKAGGALQSPAAGQKAEAVSPSPVANQDAPSHPANPNSAQAHADGPIFKCLKVMADGTLPHFIPDRRERLLDALSIIGVGPAESGTQASTRLWGHVVIDSEKCTSCRMCATFCPTGAIVKFDNDDGSFGIDHFACDCVKCLCCENICRAHAITVEDDVNASILINAVPERHIMQPERVSKGGVHSIMNSMRDLLGMPEIFER